MTDLARRIDEVLSRYGVRTHYRASREHRTTRYALFADGRQIGEPDAHAAIKARKRALEIEALASLIEEQRRG